MLATTSKSKDEVNDGITTTLRLNPQQQEAFLHFDGNDSPLRVLNGAPGYINLLDAFNAWQLVKELHEATGRPASRELQACEPGGGGDCRCYE